MLRAGERARILQIGAEGALGVRLRALALFPGREILLLAVRGGIFLVQADGLVAMDREVAACIKVQTLPAS